MNNDHQRWCSTTNALSMGSSVLYTAAGHRLFGKLIEVSSSGLQQRCWPKPIHPVVPGCRPLRDALLGRLGPKTDPHWGRGVQESSARPQHGSPASRSRAAQGSGCRGAVRGRGISVGCGDPPHRRGSDRHPGRRRRQRFSCGAGSGWQRCGCRTKRPHA